MNVDRFGVSWRGRTILVVGLGRSGMAASRALQRIGCRVRISDARDSEELRAVAARVRESGVERVELGGHSPALVEGCDAVVVSPGVPDTAPIIQEALRHGLPILSEIELAFHFCPSPIVAVTGTNGKSSLVTLIHAILTAARRPAVACGNLGTPFAEVLPSLTPQTVAVVEVSSFQLLRCEQFRPAVGILLNLGTNHLDRHQDRASYIEAKARLFARQTPDDSAVLNALDPGVVTVGLGLRAQRVWFGANRDNAARFSLGPITRQRLPASAQAAVQVGRILGIPDPLTYQAIRSFRGLEHRLEDVGTVRGVRMVNDSKSTTPESLLYALERCPGPVVPIVGGKDKGLDFSLLKSALTQERIRGLILIGEARPQLRALVNGHPPVRECGLLAEAVQEALAMARPGDTVLFSPACASFDMFKNFEERGRMFKALVRGQTHPSVSTLPVGSDPT
ncbi:MAG: UDP-N-acetylmuramoyl-L-alanine--D-glutamate ligase [Candidatus Omnitrophica bacterium]|nr:UDP-N-acetylmuramoyl-L-alanine--D-glutamate ligase [Candidatus Omnitrophota bacterium]